MEPDIVAQGFVMIAWNNDNASAVAYAPHQFLQHVIVRLRQMPTL